MSRATEWALSALGLVALALMGACGLVSWPALAACLVAGPTLVCWLAGRPEQEGEAVDLAWSVDA